MINLNLDFSGNKYSPQQIGIIQLIPKNAKYSDNQKTLKEEYDFKDQVITRKSNEHETLQLCSVNRPI